MALPLADSTLEKASIMGFTAAPCAASSTRGSKQHSGQQAAPRAMFHMANIHDSGIRSCAYT